MRFGFLQSKTEKKRGRYCYQQDRDSQLADILLLLYFFPLCDAGGK